MRQITLLSFILVFSTYVTAQIVATGKVTDTNKQAIELANVALMDKNNKIITGTITDEKGIFKLSAKAGNYKLTVSFLGYDDWEKEIILSKKLDLGVITLIERKNELDEVFLIAEKRFVGFNKGLTVYNISDKIQKSSINLASVLAKVPGLDIDKDIKLDGISGIVIKVNGKDKFSNSSEAIGFLRTLSSKEIISIEVNNTPGAKYGNRVNGVINIVLIKDDTQGVNGTVQTYLDTGEYANYGGSLYLNYRKKNINAHGLNLEIAFKRCIFTPKQLLWIPRIF